MTQKKKKNAIAAYFAPFGLKQICDITMVLAALLLIIGLFVSLQTLIVALIGSILMVLGALFALMRTVPMFFSNKNKNSMSFKNAVINTIIMTVMFALALFITIYICVALL